MFDAQVRGAGRMTEQWTGWDGIGLDGLRGTVGVPDPDDAIWPITNLCILAFWHFGIFAFSQAERGEAG